MKRALFGGLALALLLTGCGTQSSEAQIFAMNTFMTLTVHSPHAREDVKAATALINQLDRELSVTRPESEVWALNHADGNPVEVSSDTAALLKAALELGEKTSGALDVTLYPVVKAWGFTTDEHQVPGEETLSALLEGVDYSAVSLIEGEDGAAVTLPQGIELDFGALAKGYAGEVCADLLRDSGVTSALLRLGGNIQTIGARPDGKPWMIGVQDPSRPDDPDAVLGSLAIVDQAAVTSGGYQRYFEQGGVRYWHIIDPSTGSPARSGLSSVTIVADSGTLCDGLSTALFVMGREKALDFWRQEGGFEAVLVEDSGEVWITAGLSEAFTPAGESTYTLHIAEA